MKKIFIIFILLNLSLFSKNLNIALASNVSYAIKELKKEFNLLYPSIKVRLIIASSGSLSAQIQNGAPYDIFMSANMHYPQYLEKKNLTFQKINVYAKGSLVLFSKNKRDLKKGIKLISSPNIKTIALANPATAPYGKASKEVLQSLKLYEKNIKKFIYAHSISQNLTYALSAADVAFLAKSSLNSKPMKEYKEDINWIEISTKLYTPIKQGLVILKKSKNKNEAKLFYDFMLSTKAKTILKEYGYQSNE